jgi:hypothetical protein
MPQNLKLNFFTNRHIVIKQFEKRSLQLAMQLFQFLLLFQFIILGSEFIIRENHRQNSAKLYWKNYGLQIVLEYFVKMKTFHQ